MDLMDIAHNRLISQQITEKKFSDAKDLVSWMGAMQAQDYAMVKWAVGVRLPRVTEQSIETALNNGKIIRAHLLRPTWHLVSADDIYWLLELTAPKIKASLKSRHRELELTEPVLIKSNQVIEKALEDGNHLTRQELTVELEKAGIVTAGNRIYHLLLWAELDGIVCSGVEKGGKQTYALLAQRVPKTKPLSRDEALATLAKKYFNSHYPATIHDFAWWSGRSIQDAKQAMGMISSDFTSETIGSQHYWFPNSARPSKPEQETVYLLPAFDELLISYKDRSASLPFTTFKKVVSNNGIFRPFIAINGQVTGIWNRTAQKDKMIVEMELFYNPEKATKNLLEKAAIQYGLFLGRESEIRYTFAKTNRRK